MLHQVVNILHLLGGFSSVDDLKDVVRDIPRGETRTLPQVYILFLNCSSLVSASPPPSLMSRLPESALWNSGKVKRLMRTVS